MAHRPTELRLRVYPPLPPGHLGGDAACRLCPLPLCLTGQAIQLLSAGPGRLYAVAVHKRCADARSDAELEVATRELLTGCSHAPPPTFSSLVTRLSRVAAGQYNKETRPASLI